MAPPTSSNSRKLIGVMWLLSRNSYGTIKRYGQELREFFGTRMVLMDPQNVHITLLYGAAYEPDPNVKTSNTKITPYKFNPSTQGSRPKFLTQGNKTLTRAVACAFIATHFSDQKVNPLLRSESLHRKYKIAFSPQPGDIYFTVGRLKEISSADFRNIAAAAPKLTEEVYFDYEYINVVGDI